MEGQGCRGSLFSLGHFTFKKVLTAPISVSLSVISMYRGVRFTRWRRLDVLHK